MSARDLFVDIGVPLPPIAVKPISRPIYCSAGIRDFATWRETNLLALMQYWNTLSSPRDQEILTVDDFNVFTLVQYESELDRRDEMRRAYGSSRDL